MKVSEFLRAWQLTGELPEIKDDPLIAFWAGHLVGVPSIATNYDERREMAIKCAEAIEERA